MMRSTDLLLLVFMAVVFSIRTMADGSGQTSLTEATTQPADAKIAQKMLDGLGGNYTVVKTSFGALTFHYDNLLTLADAEAYCERYGEVQNGGKVAIIDSNSKRLIVENTIKKVRTYRKFATGAWVNAAYSVDCGTFKDGNERIFYQVNPTYALGYSRWAPSEPATQNGDCVVMKYSQDLKWAAVPCDGLNAFVCEWNKCSRWLNNYAGCQHEPGCEYDVMYDDCHFKGTR